MRLQRQAIQQPNHWRSDGRLVRQRFAVLFLTIVGQCHRHLPTGSKELNLLTLYQGDVWVVPIEQRTNERHRKVNEKRLVRDLVNRHVRNDPSPAVTDKAHYAIQSVSALPECSPMPEFYFTRDDLLAACNTLPPIVEHPCLVEAVLRPSEIPSFYHVNQ